MPRTVLQKVFAQAVAGRHKAPRLTQNGKELRRNRMKPKARRKIEKRFAKQVMAKAMTRTMARIAMAKIKMAKK